MWQIWLTVWWLQGCEAPSPPPAAPPTALVAPSPVTLPQLEAWLTAMGPAVETHGTVLRTVRDTSIGPYAVHVQWFEEDHLVLLQSSALVTLEEAETERGVVWLLTQIATQNYALDVGKLQLNPATGEVLLSVELETDNGLGRATFERGVRDLTDGVARVQPMLHPPEASKR